MQRFFWIDIGYACFCLLAVDGRVSYTAPIVGWMVGRQLADVKPWLRGRGAKVIEIKDLC